ncbi:hypothetical protein ACFXO7_21425 [Nocardia tengchongensis]|uniref:non-homologous end-joining DNA ligase LigD n=1 Tax=Nocardia tengchongensis TaxID=2055889 RepID=UPI00368B1D43
MTGITAAYRRAGSPAPAQWQQIAGFENPPSLRIDAIPKSSGYVFPPRRSAATVDAAAAAAQGGPMGEDARAGLKFSSLDSPLFDGAEATKGELIDYLEAVGERMVGWLRERPLSVVRVRPGQEPFMQKNLPKYTPDWVRRATLWAGSSKREVSYALCDDVRTLLWFGNQRAVEYHVTLLLAENLADYSGGPTHLVLDIDPEPGQPFGRAVAAALRVPPAQGAGRLAGAVY